MAPPAAPGRLAPLRGRGAAVRAFRAGDPRSGCAERGAFAPRLASSFFDFLQFFPLEAPFRLGFPGARQTMTRNGAPSP